MSEPAPLAQDLAAASRRQPFGLPHMLGSLLFVLGLVFLLGDERARPGAPRATETPPPPPPRASVFAGAVGEAERAQPLAWCTTLQVGERAVAATKLGAFGEGPLPLPARFSDPEAPRRGGFLLVDPLRAEPLEVAAALEFPGARAAERGLEVGQDLAAYALHPGSPVELLRLREELPAVGTPVWVYAPRPGLPQQVLGEVALARPDRLAIRLEGREFASLGGAPWQDASGAVVGLTVAATEHEEGVLVYAIPSTRVRDLLARAAPR